MAAQYQHQLHAHHHRKRHPKRWIVVAVLLVVGVGVWLHSLQPGTSITKSKVVTKTVANQNTTKKWTEPTFSLSLPTDWVQAGAQTAAHYHFQGGQSGIDDSRTLDVYVDTIPSLAVNRVLPIEANGPGIDVTGSVSANCSTFTGNGTHSPGEAPAPAVWDNLPFICDLANYQRDVIGTLSNQGINHIGVSGPSGTHEYFFVYTDSSYTADYDIFTAALDSFQAS